MKTISDPLPFFGLGVFRSMPSWIGGNRKYPLPDILTVKSAHVSFQVKKAGLVRCIHTATELRVGEREPRRKASS